MRASLRAVADNDAIAEIVQVIEETPPEELFANVRSYLLGILPKLGWALLVLLLGYFVIRLLLRLIRQILKRSRVDKTLHSFILSAIAIVLYLLLGLTAMGVLGIPLTPLVTALGAFGLALSLAVKDSLSNVAGGISVLFSRPFGVGDYVDIGSTSGTIRELGLVYTQLRTVDNKHIYLPNGDVSKATIVNYSREGQRRLDMYFQIRVGCDVETARKIIVDAVKGCPLALDEPSPIIRVVDQTYAMVKFCCNVWVNKESMADLKDYLISTVRIRFVQAGIDPVNFHEQKDVEREANAPRSTEPQSTKG